MGPEQMSELRTIVVDGAPKAIGPYAQGIAAGGFLFTAGQTPLDPATSAPMVGGSTTSASGIVTGVAKCDEASIAKAVADTIARLTELGYKGEMREGDTLARLGGDEFVAVLLDLPTISTSASIFTSSAKQAWARQAWPYAYARTAGSPPSLPTA